MKATVTASIRRHGDYEIQLTIRYGERCFSVMRSFSPYTDPRQAFSEAWRGLKEALDRELGWEALDGLTISVPIPLPDTPPISLF